MWNLTPDTWHLTPDMWHLTYDTWWGVNILLKCQLSSCYGLGYTGSVKKLTERVGKLLMKRRAKKYLSLLQELEI